jgi:hypothetical protein
VVNVTGVRWAVSRHRAPGRLSAVLLGLVAVLALAAAVGLVGYAFLPERTTPTWLPAFKPLVLTTTANPPTKGSIEPPLRVRIRKIGVNAKLEELHLDSHGQLQAPKDYDQAGWYADGTAPGQPGPAVIAGHIDSKYGRAVFFRLKELREGDVIEVLRKSGWIVFRVTTVDRYAKRAFPTNDVYGPTPDAQLRLITCGGPFDRSARSYVDNVVVYATVS